MTQHDGDLIRITPRFKYTSTPDVFVNNWYIQLDSAGDVSDEVMVADIGSWLETVYEDILDQQVTAYEYVDWDWANVTQDLVYPAENWPTYTAGIVTGDVLPGALCAYGFGRTAYSRVIGKKYFNGMAESNNQATGIPASAVVTAVATVLATGWGNVGTPNGNTFRGKVVSTLHGNVDVQVVVAPNAWRWLRRRMSGIGG